MPQIDIVKIKTLCHNGKLKAFVSGKSILLEERESGETVLIGAAPTIDAATVVNGRWIKEWSNIPGREVEHCSECEAPMDDRNQFWDAPYCPSCGAKMEKGAP